ncbi:Fic family protein [Stenotrophomonas sp. VV52]|uniref:Fic/DOC family protein n=1 Tax=Stenotrophomonas sp. VV52 TaxID=2066958 RepID=UPI000C9DAF0C|nr:Fic family protein [Stenotrophomonas sp. VV52]
MFDPFKDFEQRGYLRNHFAEKDPDVVRKLEHELFRSNLEDAINYLIGRRVLGYADFLQVHRALFAGLYPWAGQDRAVLAPDIAVSKAGTWFSHPLDAQRAVEAAFDIAKDPTLLRARHGEVMGLFAFGHPFLDGNGRTMLIVHSELCHRAGFSIEWSRTRKTDYLTVLTAEIASPGRGLLDSYLNAFVGAQQPRHSWGGSIHSLSGLDGRGAQDAVEGIYSEANVSEKYRELQRQRCYQATQ